MGSEFLKQAWLESLEKKRKRDEAGGVSPRKSGMLRLQRWVTMDWRIVRVCEMTDRHLLNCIRYVLRLAPERLFQRLSEVAYDDIGKISELWGERDAWIKEIPDIFKDMVAEANDRGLEVIMVGDQYRHVTKEALDVLLGSALEGAMCREEEYQGEIRPGGRKMTNTEITFHSINVGVGSLDGLGGFLLED